LAKADKLLGASQQGERMSEADDRIANALMQANAAARRGDIREAERWSKVATAMAAAASAARPSTLPDTNEKERRAELRRRLVRYVDACQENQRWEADRDHYWAMMQTAVANGTEPPPPLRPHPCGPLGEVGNEAYMTNILIGPEPRD
jgi:hypothetical protein